MTNHSVRLDKIASDLADPALIAGLHAFEKANIPDATHVEDHVRNLSCRNGQIVAMPKGTVAPDMNQLLARNGFDVYRNNTQGHTLSGGHTNLRFSNDLHTA